MLINSATHEPIDWDCPNPKAFDEFFFSRHLDWRLEQGDDESRHVQELHKEVKLMFSELVKDGLIREYQMPMGLVYLWQEDDSR